MMSLTALRASSTATLSRALWLCRSQLKRIGKSGCATQRGFGLVELLIAMVVLTVGLLAVAVLIMYGIRIQTFARDATLASGAAKQRLEILRNMPRTDAMRQNGGSLVANVAPFFAPVDLDPNQAGIDTPFVVRWMVAAGPAGTQDVTVVVVSTSPARQLPPLQFRSQLP